MRTLVSVSATLSLALAIPILPATGQEEKADKPPQPKQQQRQKQVQQQKSDNRQVQSRKSDSKSSATGSVSVTSTADGDGKVRVIVNGKEIDLTGNRKIQRPVQGGRGDERPVQKGKKDMVAFLGVSTRPIDDGLRQHLDLPEGFGLQIEHVVPDSPAGEAGLRSHDILVKIDDQQLTTPEHLALLVRARKPGEEVTLTYLRKGKEEKAEIRLDEREDDHRAGFFRNVPGAGGGVFEMPRALDRKQMPPMPVPPGPNADQDAWHRAMKEYQDQWQKWLKEQAPNWQPAPNRPQAPKLRGPDRPGGKPPAISVRPGFPVQVFGSAGVVKIDNGMGEVTIEEKDGQHTICIKNRDGEVVHEGEYDPEKGTESLPEKARKHLEEMKLQDLKVLTPGVKLFRSPNAPAPVPPGEKKDRENIKKADPVPDRPGADRPPKRDSRKKDKIL